MLSEKFWKPEAVVRLFLSVVVCFLGGALLTNLAHRFIGMHFDDSPWRVIITAISFQGVPLFFVHRFVREHETTWAGAFGFNNNWKLAVILGVVFAIVFLPIGLGLKAAIVKFLGHFNVEFGEQPAIRALGQTQGIPDFIALACVTMVLAPLAEELLFRGVLYPAIRQLGFPRLALWGTSLLFAGIHFDLPTFLPLLVLALILTLLYEKTGNLLAPIATHSFFNTMNFVMFYYTYRA